MSILNEEEIDRILKKELVKQLQDLKRKDVDRAAFYYDSKGLNTGGMMVLKKNRHSTKNRKSLANKRRFYELINHKKQMMAFEESENPNPYQFRDGLTDEGGD